MTENKKVMARNITDQMIRKGVNASDVCNALNIKHNTFSDWVNAKTYPRIDKIEAMAAYFGIPKFMLVENMDKIIDSLPYEKETINEAIKIYQRISKLSPKKQDDLLDYLQYLESRP